MMIASPLETDLPAVLIAAAGLDASAGYDHCAPCKPYRFDAFNDAFNEAGSESGSDTIIQFVGLLRCTELLQPVAAATRSHATCDPRIRATW
jgi:hypothetical protein